MLSKVSWKNRLGTADGSMADFLSCNRRCFVTFPMIQRYWSGNQWKNLPAKGSLLHLSTMDFGKLWIRSETRTTSKVFGPAIRPPGSYGKDGDTFLWRLFREDGSCDWAYWVQRILVSALA